MTRRLTRHRAHCVTKTSTLRSSYKSSRTSYARSAEVEPSEATHVCQWRIPERSTGAVQNNFHADAVALRGKAMPNMTGGQALAKSLYREGVRVIFGLPGVQ